MIYTTYNTTTILARFSSQLLAENQCRECLRVCRRNSLPRPRLVPHPAPVAAATWAAQVHARLTTFDADVIIECFRPLEHLHHINHGRNKVCKYIFQYNLD